MSADRRYENARDLLPVLELNRVTAYEVAGKRVPSSETTEIKSSMESMIGGEEGVAFIFRVRQRVKTDEAEITADFEVEYRFSEPGGQISEDALVEFAEKVAFMALVPYLRESVHTTAMRLGVQPPLLGMVRQGEFRLRAEDEIVSGRDPQD
ncbi:hypothetical protein E4J66_10745 [Actinomyces viscosus]|uniref:Preprotein translocase subunit SecB n=1 Tax=Actinomyces viscosus TaxID=1656 RepID=A0A3S4VF56_ACTVI|nr:hypothetical protein [Actinomyces viscosus]TFH51789.1 hypothetical protein E4J66_10745 [Actinomyces viscosus]VEI17488.1 Uncharacterised protein [Actinomyces viscosus]